MNASVEPKFRTIDGLAIRYAETRTSEARDEHALLLNPWPESILAFEPTWERLAEAAHLVAVDLPGFGRSERRDNLLAPRALGAFVIEIADAFELECPHAVGPDIGTAALLFAEATHPGRFRSLVVGSGASAYPLELGGVLREWVEAPDLDAFRAADGREIVGAVLKAIERYALTGAAREDYLASYAGDRFVESMRYVRAYPTELPMLGALLAHIEAPVQIISGARDDAVLPINAQILRDCLPHSKLDFIDAGHFVWEDGADEYGQVVARWLSGGYRAV